MEVLAFGLALMMITINCSTVAAFLFDWLCERGEGQLPCLLADDAAWTTTVTAITSRPSWSYGLSVRPRISTAIQVLKSRS